jgi:DNA primase
VEIPAIKSRLSLETVLNHYQLTPDKNGMLHCPFHEDRKPSMQVYPKTGTCYCFSSNCKTHGKSLDVIDFIMFMEFGSLSEAEAKHQAILKAKSFLSNESDNPQELSRSAVLTKLFTYFRNGIYNSKPALDYLEKRGQDVNKLEVGYNTGQFHHGKRRNEHFIRSPGFAIR